MLNVLAVGAGFFQFTKHVIVIKQARELQVPLAGRDNELRLDNNHNTEFVFKQLIACKCRIK